MNDDFLRRMRRPPSAAFEQQLRERLRQQELKETSRRRPSWRLLAISLLIGGSALATATYLTITRSPTAPPPIQSAPTPVASVPDEPQDGPQNFFHSQRPGAAVNEQIWIGASSPSSAQQATPTTAIAPDNSRSATDSSSTSTTEGPRYISTTGSGSSTTTRPIRIVATPDIAVLAKDESASSSFEVDSADNALPTLCEEETADQPDIVVTSRRARKEEFKLCSKRYNGEVWEATLGHIAIVVTRAKNGSPMQLTSRTLRLALQKQVPAPDNSSQLIDNPYTHWNQIDPSLEDRRIEILGPARDSPEFIVFAATLLAPACENNGSLDPQLCNSVREDGVYGEARFDANFVPQRLWSDPNVVAIMDYRFYAANSGDLLGSLLSGAAPTRESILDGSYAGARTLRAYVNRLRYRSSAKVSLSVDQYLRQTGPYNRKGVIPPDGNFDVWRPYSSGPKLTEVKFD